MTASTPRSGRTLALLALCALIGVGLVMLWFISLNKSKINTASATLEKSAPQQAPTNSTNTGRSSWADSGLTPPLAMSPVPLAAKDLAWVHSMKDLLLRAPNASDDASRSYAVFMPSILCSAIVGSQTSGRMSLKSNLRSIQIPANERGLERIKLRCSDYVGVDRIRSTVIADLKVKNAPLSAFFATKDKFPEEARANLGRALLDHDATALQPLALTWGFDNAGRVTESLPESLKPYGEGIATAAFDIALCRAGAACAADSIALDMVCAKFGECDVTDVESAYRRLHVAAGIPFDETSRIADELRDAIRRRDTIKLWPDSASPYRKQK